jgi:hypothetical protein
MSPTTTSVVIRTVSQTGASHTHSATTAPTHTTNVAMRSIHFFMSRPSYSS